MIRTLAAAVALLTGVAQIPDPAPVRVPAEDAELLRLILAEVGPDYCVTAALDPAPFSGARRKLAEYDEMTAELAEADGKPPPAPRDADADAAADADADAFAAALRDRAGDGWTTDGRRPLDGPLLADITDAAAMIAERGDPTLLAPVEGMVAFNMTADADGADEPDAALERGADPVAVEADSIAPLADDAGEAEPGPSFANGRIEPLWLARGQRLADRCPFPTASLSAVARAGDFAFVSVGLVWAPLAGRGETWVMQRTAGGWRRVARREDWIA